MADATGKVVRHQGRWAARYKTPQGKWKYERPKGRNTKLDAQRLLSERLVEIHQDTYCDRNVREIKLCDFWKDWYDAGKECWKPNTRATYKTVVETHLLNPKYGLGHLGVREITYRTVERFRTNMREQRPDLSSRSINLPVSLLGQILGHAVKHDICSGNAAKGFPRLPKKKRVVEVLTPEQIERVLQVAREIDPDKLRLEALVNLGFRTGLRPGELAALRWRDIDLDKRVLHVRGTNSDKSSLDSFVQTGAFNATKTDGSDRRVVMSRKLVKDLRGFKMRSGNRPDSEVVFTNKKGKPLDTHNLVNRWWKQLREKAELPADFTPHCMRHCYASHMLSKGMPLEFVSRQLGHASTRTTQEVYRHLIEDRDDVHAEGIEEALAVGSGR